MDKTTFRKFAKLVGNEADLKPLANEYDESMPENWDEMSEEEQAAWKEKHMVANEDKPTPPAATPAVTSNAQAAPPAKVEVPAEITQLAGLVKEVGGVDALKTLLVNAAKISVSAQAEEDLERASLTAKVKANSVEFGDEELKEMPIGTLRKVANSLQPITVDYSAVAPRTVANKADQIAPRPSLLIKTQGG
jgi:hypothetical protein